MDAHGLVSPKRLHLVAALLYATVVSAGIIWALGKSAVTTPLMMIALGAPLIFRLVPRNYLYGMRFPRTLWTTEETWYRQNTITGVAMVLIGVVWLAVLALAVSH